jgi:acyl-homoserine lactone acylase PvdQ
MFRRILLLGFALLVILPAGTALYLFWAAKRAEPAYSGTLELAALSAPVTVRYGAHAVPSVEAGNLSDLLFAQGFLVASERMWQMDLMRRLAQGRLAEALGEKALKADRFFRTIGLGRTAARSVTALDEAERAHLEAYAAGVNAYIAGAVGRLPLEYLIAGFEPAPWTPADSLAIGEYMAWMLSFNVREELVYLRLAARVGKARALELFPVDEGVPAPERPSDLPDLSGEIPHFQSLFSLVGGLGLPVPGPASNAWAINGRRTEDGRALLANDPHLAPSMPGIWYELELHAPQLHVAGAVLPGVPFVAIGHNEHIAWGFTTVIADTQDIFVERPVGDGRAVQRPEGRTEPIAKRIESIEVKGRSRPVRLEIRSTSHGTIINDVLGNNTGTPMDLTKVATADLLALRTNLEVPDRASVAFYRLNSAETIAEGRAAMADLRRASMNLMMADREGSIAWQVSGLLPQRGRGTGQFPSPGWEPGYGWTGYVDPSRNPSLVDPPGYALVTANHRTVPPDHEVALSNSWMAPYRAQRVEQMLSARNPLTAEDLADMQLDRMSLQALRFKEALGAVVAEVRVLDGEARIVADEILMGWDGDFEPDSRGAALFLLLQPALFEALYGDELDEDLDALMSIGIAHYNALEETLYSGESSFWDDEDTPEQESATHVWARALREAKEELDRRLPEPGSQRLDALRHLSFPHAFDRIPVIGDLFSVGPLPVGGDAHTVNTMKTSLLEPERATFIPTLRAVLTPADWSGSRTTLPLGQSGHRFSPYRTDQLDDWLEGRTHPLQWEGPAPGEEIGVLVLKPPPAEAEQESGGISQPSAGD